MDTTRRSWLLAAASAVAAPAVSSRTLKMEPVEIHVQSSDQLRQLPVMLAKYLGHFEAEGIEVSLTPTPAHALSLADLAQLPSVLFAGSFERVLYLHALGNPHRAFALLSRGPQMVFGVSALHHQAGMRVADLAGATVGVRHAGSLSERVARWELMRGGLRSEDVRFVELPDHSQAMAALNSGDVDALCYGDPIATHLEMTGVLRVLSDTRTLRDTQRVFGGPMACTCLSAPAAYVDTHPEVVQRLTHAVVRTLMWLRTAGPSDLMRRVPEHLMHGHKALFLESFMRSRETFAADGTIEDTAPMNVMRALHRLRMPLDWARVQVDTTYTNRFAQRARQRWRV